MLVPQELQSMCVTGQSGPRLASVWCPPFRASPPLTTCSPLVWRNQKTCFANLRLLIWPDAGFCSFGWPRLVSVSAIWGIKPVTCLTQPETVSRWFDRSADPTQMGSTGVPPPLDFHLWSWSPVELAPQCYLTSFSFFFEIWPVDPQGIHFVCVGLCQSCQKSVSGCQKYWVFDRGEIPTDYGIADRNMITFCCITHCVINTHSILDSFARDLLFWEIFTKW